MTDKIVNGRCPKGLCDGESQYDVLEKPFGGITDQHILRWVADHIKLSKKFGDGSKSSVGAIEEIDRIASFLAIRLEELSDQLPASFSEYYKTQTSIPLCFSQSNLRIEECRDLTVKAKLGEGLAFGVSKNKATNSVNEEFGLFESFVKMLETDWRYLGISREPDAEKAIYLRKYFRPNRLADQIPSKLIERILRLPRLPKEDLASWTDIIFELSNIDGLSMPSFAALRRRAMTEARGLMGTRKNKRKASFIKRWGAEYWSDESDMDDLDCFEQIRCAKQRKAIKNLKPTIAEWEKALRSTVKDQFSRLVSD